MAVEWKKIILSDELANYCPYTGANANVDLGSYDLTTTGTLGAGAITGTSLTDGTATLTGGALTGVTGGIQLDADNAKLYFGAGDDASITYDGTNQNFDLTSGNFVFTGGNVGMGTASPQHNLDIQDTIGATLKIHSTGSNPSIAGAIELLEHDDSNFAANYGEANAYGAKLYYDGSANLFHIGMGIGISTLNALSIERNTGNVGIGTAPPSEKLDVVGDIKVSADIHNFADNGKHFFGAGDDSYITDTGSLMTIVPDANTAGSRPLTISGDLDVTGTVTCDTSITIGSTTLTEQNLIDLLALLA